LFKFLATKLKMTKYQYNYISTKNKKYKSRDKHSMDIQLFTCLLLVLSWGYFDVSEIIFKLLQPCPDNHMYLFPYIECSGDTFYYLVSMAAVFLLLYVIGTPVLFTFVSKSDKFEKAAGFLYQPFYRRLYFLSVILRRLFISVCLVEFSPGTLWLFVSISLIFVFFIVLHYFMRPYVKSNANMIDFSSSIVMLLTYSCLSYISQYPTRDNSHYYVQMGLLIIANGCVVFTLMYFIIMDFFDTSPPIPTARSAYYSLLTANDFVVVGNDRKYNADVVDSQASTSSVSTQNREMNENM